MKLLYDLLTIILIIAAAPLLLFRLFKEKNFGERLRQSFGFLPYDELGAVIDKNCIWIHAASVGEIVAASPIVKEIRREIPDRPILVSVVTASGYEMANRIIKEADNIIFFPWDLPGLAQKELSIIKPGIFLPVETELWPNFLYSIRRMDVPVVMVNGRISDKSVDRYKYLRGILQDMLSTVDRFCMQSMIDAQYIIRLGAAPRRVFVTGNTKFDQTYTDITPQQEQELKAEFGFYGRKPILICGSTHEGEEEMLLSAFRKVKEKFPEAGLILAPRDIYRSDELLMLSAKNNLQSVRRTQVGGTTTHDVVVLDTIGELGMVYGIGDLVVVGGSLVPHGGHNLLEPAAHCKPIIVGPHMFNFKDSYALFSSRGACETAYDEADLADKILEILNSEQRQAEMAAHAAEIIRENRGAAARNVQHIKQIMALKSNKNNS